MLTPLASIYLLALAKCARSSPVAASPAESSVEASAAATAVSVVLNGATYVNKVRYKYIALDTFIISDASSKFKGSGWVWPHPFRL